MFTNQDVMVLRDKTGAGIMDCKKALTESGGDMEAAVKYLREKGIAAAAKKAERIAAEGLVDAYKHFNGRVGVLIEVNCETDFVAKSGAFKELCANIAMHIAAAKPEYVTEAEVPTAALEAEKDILRNQALNEGKPAQIIDKMVEGRVKKYYEDVCLLQQKYVKNPEITIKDLVTEATLKIGEKISVRRFTRYEVGEGLAKRSDNLAEEVAKQMADAKK